MPIERFFPDPSKLIQERTERVLNDYAETLELEAHYYTDTQIVSFSHKDGKVYIAEFNEDGTYRLYLDPEHPYNK